MLRDAGRVQVVGLSCGPPGLGPLPVRALEDTLVARRRRRLAPTRTASCRSRSSERSFASRDPSRPPKRTWIPASPGVRRFPPSSTCRPCVHSPGSEDPVRCRRSHPPTSRSVLVVSHHLDGFLRTTVAGLLHPAADLGVRRVSRPRATQRIRASSDPGDPDVPRDGVHTLRRVPLVRSRTASLRPFALVPLPAILPMKLRSACADPHVIDRSQAGSRAFLHERVRCDPAPLPAADRSLLPWAWFPLEVRSPPAARRRSGGPRSEERHPGPFRHGESCRGSRDIPEVVHRARAEARDWRHLRLSGGHRREGGCPPPPTCQGFSTSKTGSEEPSPRSTPEIGRAHV